MINPFLAIEDKKNDLLESYLKTENVNIQNEENETLLHFAIKYNNEQAFNMLIKSYININLKDNYGNTPLMFCVLYDRLGFFKRLVRENANLNSLNNNHETAIMMALSKNKPEMVKILFECDVDLNITNDNGENIYFSIVKSHNLELLEFLIHNNEQYLFSINTSKRTLLHQSVMISDYRITEFLLNHGLMPNQEDCFGETPIFFAIRNKDEQMIELLIKYGALLGKVNSFFESVYDIASNQIKLFLKFKEESVAYNKYLKKYPLHVAVIYNDYIKVKQLVNKSNIIKKDDKGFLPIEYAERLNHLEIYKLLKHY